MGDSLEKYAWGHYKGILCVKTIAHIEMGLSMYGLGLSLGKPKP